MRSLFSFGIRMRLEKAPEFFDARLFVPKSCRDDAAVKEVFVLQRCSAEFEEVVRLGQRPKRSILPLQENAKK